jgi:hypothetical protein
MTRCVSARPTYRVTTALTATSKPSQALHDWSSDYRTAFILCMSVEIAAAVVVLLGRRRV